MPLRLPVTEPFFPGAFLTAVASCLRACAGARASPAVSVADGPAELRGGPEAEACEERAHCEAAPRAGWAELDDSPAARPADDSPAQGSDDPHELVVQRAGWARLGWERA